MSIGSNASSPPSSSARATVASASATANETPQNPGASSGIPAGGFIIPATPRSPTLSTVYGAPPKSWRTASNPKIASKKTAAPSMSWVTSVFHARLTGSLTSSAPVCEPACQAPNAPPARCM